MPAPSGRARLGIDLGGTKIAGIVLDSRGATLAEARVPAPRGDYRGTLEALAALVERLESEAGTPSRAPCSVGVGMPGSLSPATGLVRNANSHWLNGHPFGIDLARRLDRVTRATGTSHSAFVERALTETIERDAEAALRGLGALRTRQTLRPVLRIAAVSAVAGGAGWLVRIVTDDLFGTSTAGSLAAVLVGTVVIGGVALAGLAVARVPELAAPLAAVRARMGRG